LVGGCVRVHETEMQLTREAKGVARR